MTENLEQKPGFQKLLKTADEYLRRQKEAGEPMVLHFEDVNHYSSSPADIATSKPVHELAKKYGNPLMCLKMLMLKDQKKR